MTRLLRLALTAAPLAAGCAGSDSRGDAQLRVRHDTIGDTIVIHTISGRAWGGPARLVADLTIGVLEGPDHYMFGQIQSLAVGPDGDIFVFDSHSNELRRYAADGSFLAVIGREGGGPGEYRNPDGGLAVLDDGRILLRDPGNARIGVYAADGAPLDEWRVTGSFSTSRRLYTDTTGSVYTTVGLDPTEDFMLWRFGLLRYDRDGPTADTLPIPVYDVPPPIVARMEEGDSRRIASLPVPFAPSAHWAFSPLGYFVAGLSTRYAIDLHRPDGALRIGRDHEPVPVQPQEREDAERRATAQMRRVDPSWRWNGPPIPEKKPPYRDFFIGEDGRIWVQLYQEARAVEADEGEATAEAGGAEPGSRWVEAVAFDVFAPDGRYLGLVRGPEGLSIFPTPTARGDTLWAVVRDELEVPYIERFHIERDGAR